MRIIFSAWGRRSIFFFSFFLLFTSSPVLADIEPIDVVEDRYDVGVVENIQEDDAYIIFNTRFTSGPRTGEVVSVYEEIIRGIRPLRLPERGQKIIVHTSSLSEPSLLYEDIYRLPKIGLIVLFFFLIVILLIRLKGLASITNLALAFGVIITFVVPQIAQGANPMFICLIGSFFLLVLSLFLSHGIKRTTMIALASSTLTIGLSVVIGFLFIDMAHVFGTGQNEAFFLQFGNLSHINLKGLLLGGMIIATVGVLDDVTVVQTSTIEELNRLDSSLSAKDLYARAMNVGREHIVSMVNTLFIVYAGASLPVFLFYMYQENISTPLWVTLNAEQITEEILRSILGSLILVLAVPLTTLLAAYHYGKKKSVL